MKCPAPIDEILAQLLLFGFIVIQTRSEDAQFCARVAYHLHNLPSILINYTPGRLHYYWNVERVQFISESKPDDLKAFEHWWNQLEPFVPAENKLEQPARKAKLVA